MSLLIPILWKEMLMWGGVMFKQDSIFTNGVLAFENMERFKLYYDSLKNGQRLKTSFGAGFKSLKSYFAQNEQKIKETQPAVSQSSSPSQAFAAPISTAPATEYWQDVPKDEFIYDVKSSILDDDYMPELLNEDLQVQIGNELFQFTRIGELKVDVAVLPVYKTLLDANATRLYSDPSFTKFPNEVPLGTGKFQVATGIVRAEGSTNNILADRPVPVEPGGGGGGGTTPPPTPAPNPPVPSAIVYDNYTVTEKFNKEVTKDMGDNKRFFFQVYKFDYNLFPFFKNIGIEGKCQKRKKFLGVKYWGNTYADEIIVGCDNMYLWTDYVFPYPQQYNLQRPTFDGLADYKIGNFAFKALGLKINVKALGYTLNNTQITNLINGQVNNVIGNQYNNLFKEIENRIIGSIDPSYPVKYANYKKLTTSLDDKNRFEMRFGFTEKPEGYSHKNKWGIDFNVGFGGAEYKYDMKGGSFFGRARLGNNWYAMRIVRI